MSLSTIPQAEQQSTLATEHVDVLIVGAGISGIGCAYYLQKEHPGRSYDPRGARRHRRHVGPVPLPRDSVGLRPAHLRLRVQAVARRGRDRRRPTRSWPTCARRSPRTASTPTSASTTRCSARRGQSDDARWTVDVERADTGELVQFSANWLFCAGGYYRYDQGYTPEFEGRDRFGGQVVHPQHWPEDLDYTGKKVVVIGSGATAVTLVPAMAGTAAHVTMLQRSPTYVMPVPSKDTFANAPRSVLGAKRGYALSAPQEHRQAASSTSSAGAVPRAAGGSSGTSTPARLPEGYPVDEHFNPSYNPWDQRLCAVPDGDLFKAIAQRRRLGGHRSDRDLHRDRHPAGVRQAPRRRHHRHRNRFERPAVRRYVS